MNKILFVVISVLSTSCNSISSQPVATMPIHSGPVFISTFDLPKEVVFTKIGTVSAHANSGYGGADSLYPELAAEARKLGANAIVSVRAGRQVSAFSWSAPNVTGTAIFVSDQALLKNMNGQMY